MVMILPVATNVAESTQPPGASLAMGLSTALIAVVLLAVLGIAGRGALTMAHEGGHALTSFVLGGSVQSIRVHPTGDGATSHAGGGWGYGVLVSLAGYLGPSLFGLVFALIVISGEPAAVLWATLVLLAVSLIVLRGLFTWAVVLATGAVFYLTVADGSLWAQTLLAYSWSWFLLLGGVLGTLELRNYRRRVRASGLRDRDSDAAHLWQDTWVPAPLWVGGFILASLAALVLGAIILLDLRGGG